jgi:hypothetical protein
MDVDPNDIMGELPRYARGFYNALTENNIENSENQNEYEGEFGTIIRKQKDDNNILQLYQTTQKGKECRWEFYEKDADPHPSVPHGHGIQKTLLRLDPYRRTMYKKQNGLNIIGFEKKKFIKSLWNDNNFRDYALRAIKNFIASGIVGRNYNWHGIRGIRNPHRLPRKRK